MLYPLLAFGALLCPLSRPLPSMGTVPQEAASESIVRVYDIGSLTGLDQLRALEPVLKDSGASQPALRKAFDEALRTRKGIEGAPSPKSIIQNIERFLTPAPGPEFKPFVFDDSQLAVSATPSQHTWIRNYLDAAARTDTLVEISLYLCSLKPGSLATLGIEVAPEGTPVEDAEALLAKITALEDAEKVTAPRVTIFPGAKMSISVVNEMAYVKDCEVNLVGDPAEEVVTPIVDKLSLGFTMLARALPIGPETTAIEAEINWSRLRSPLDKVEKTFGESKTKVKIQTPDIALATLDARFDLESKGAFIITANDDGGSGPDAEPQQLVAIISALQLVAAPEDEEPVETDK